MAQRRKEERARKAELNRLDNEECGEEEEEEELTDESDEEVTIIFFCCCSETNYAIDICSLSSCAHIKPDLLFLKGVEDLLGGDDGEEEEKDEEEGSVAQSIRSSSPVARTRPSRTPDLVHTDGTLMLFPGNSCSRTG